jgi:hypothetical protein
LTTLYSQRTVSVQEGYLFATAFAKVKGIESEFLGSCSLKAVKASVLARRSFHLAMKNKTVEAHQWISLGTHLLTGTVLCNLDSVSPPASGSAATKSVNSQPITVEEVIAALPPTGILIGVMLKQFSRRIKDKKDRDRFIKMVKENSVYNSEDKLLRPKAA